MGVSSGEDDTLKQTRENENRREAKSFDAIYKNIKTEKPHIDELEFKECMYAKKKEEIHINAYDDVKTGRGKERTGREVFPPLNIKRSFLCKGKLVTKTPEYKSRNSEKKIWNVFCFKFACMLF